MKNKIFSFTITFLISLFFVIQHAICSENKQLPAYIVTIPVYVPQPIVKLNKPKSNEYSFTDSYSEEKNYSESETSSESETEPVYYESDGESDSEFSEKDFKKPPYSIHVHHTSRGILKPIEKIEKVRSSNDGTKITKGLLKLFTDESFGNNAETSQEEVKKRLGVSLLLNRMESLSNARNQSLKENSTIKFDDYQWRESRYFWRPTWQKTTIGAGHKITETVCFKEVKRFFRAFKKYNKEKAIKFLDDQENKIEEKNLIIPYRELREELCLHQNTKDIVKHFKSKKFQHLFFATFDSDITRLRKNGKGLFTAYDEFFSTKPNVNVMSTGYSISSNSDIEGDLYYFIWVGVEIDRYVRAAVARTFPKAIYYPEPNTLFKIDQEDDCLDFSFHEWGTKGIKNYQSPQESKIAIQSIDKQRKLTDNQFVFAPDNPVSILAPARMSVYRKKVDSPMKPTGRWDQEQQKLVGWDIHDIKLFRQIAQNHLLPTQWVGDIYKSLEPLLLSTKKLSKLSFKEVKFGTLNYVNKKITSLITGILSCYDPITIALKENDKNESNFKKALYTIINNYSSKKPVELAYEYKEGENKLSADQKRFKDLTEKTKNLDDLKKLIDCFYTESVADRIEEAAKASGQAIAEQLHQWLDFRVLEEKKKPKMGKI